MPDLLIDTGPLLAAFNQRDQHHAFVVGIMRQHNQPFVTTMAVMTEIMYLSRARLGPHVQDKLFVMIERGDILVEHTTTTDFSRIATLMQKYRDLPMDFADATLVALAERLGSKRIFTIDLDFAVYRWQDKHAFELICP
jgi:uncharacterized protein